MNKSNARPNWDDWFMGMCCWTATRSPDIHTSHGSVLCDQDHRLLGVGYNGFPRGCDDSKLPLDRPRKYETIIHSESNCLLNSPQLHVGGYYTMYITGFPCPKCFIEMMQFGVNKIVYGSVESKCVDKEKIDLVYKLAAMRDIELKLSNTFDCRKMIEVFRNLKGLLSLETKE